MKEIKISKSSYWKLLSLIIILHSSIVSIQAFTRRFEHEPWKHRGDEAIYFGAGKAIWHSGEVANKITEYHPPLTYYLNSIFLPAALPRWQEVTDYTQLPNTKKQHWEQMIDTIGLDLVFQTMQDEKSVGWLMFRGRLPFLLLSFLFLISIAKYFRRYSPAASLFACFSFALFPPILFFVPTMLTDFAFLVFFVWTLICLDKYCQATQKRRYLYFGAFFMACASASKVSGLLLLPALLWPFYQDFKNTSSQASRENRIFSLLGPYVVAGLIYFCTIWAAYGFQVDSMKNAEAKHFSFPSARIAGNKIPDSAFEKLFPNIYERNIPAVSFIMALRYANSITKDRFISDTSPIIPKLDNPAWFWLNMLLSYVPFSILLALALILVRKFKFGYALDANSWMYVSIGLVFLFFTVKSPYQLGIRHYLPIYAAFLLFVLMNLNALSAIQKKIVMGWSVIIVFPWLISYGIYYLPQKWWLYALLRGSVKAESIGVLVN